MKYHFFGSIKTYARSTLIRKLGTKGFNDQLATGKILEVPTAAKEVEEIFYNGELIEKHIFIKRFSSKFYRGLKSTLKGKRKNKND